MPVNALIFTELSLRDSLPPNRAAGAYRIATEIRKAGYSCQVIDYVTKFSFDELYSILDYFVGEETLIVGFSSTFFTYVDTEYQPFQTQQLDTNHKMGLRIKYVTDNLSTMNYPYHPKRMTQIFDHIYKKNPKVKIVYGGAKAQFQRALCDTFAIGYSDASIVHYMKYLEGKNSFFQFETTPSGNAVIVGDSCYFDFSTSTIDWHESDFVRRGEVLPIEISRGCVFNCAYCYFPLRGKKNLDHIKKESVLRDEFLRNYHEYGVTRYVYSDDTHNDSMDKLRMLHKVVQSLPFEIEYVAYMRHDLIYANKDSIKLLRESGLRSVMFGIETLNHDAGKAIGKGLHPEKTKELMHRLKEDEWKNEVGIFSGFIVGLPHETPETVNKWFEWVMDKKCPIDTFIVTGLEIKAQKHNLHFGHSILGTKPEKYGYTLYDNGTWRSAYFDTNSALRQAQALLGESFRLGRHRIGGMSAVTLSNLGYIPKEIIGKPSVELFTDSIPKKGKKLIDEYKANVLARIGYIKP